MDRFVGIGEAARTLGVAVMTLRRCGMSGKTRLGDPGPWRSRASSRLADRQLDQLLKTACGGDGDPVAGRLSAKLPADPARVNLATLKSHALPSTPEELERAARRCSERGPTPQSQQSTPGPSPLPAAAAAGRAIPSGLRP